MWYGKAKRKRRRGDCGRYSKLHFERLEERQMLAVFEVNTAFDHFDLSDNSHPTNPIVTLREAIFLANAEANVGGPDRIHFNIGGGGIQTLLLAADFPAITDPVIIDGYTQPGASENTGAVVGATDANILIELESITIGGRSPSVGLAITPAGSGSTIRGLAFSGFRASEGAGQIAAIRVDGNDNIIEGNFFGVGHSGSELGQGNAIGVHVRGQNNRIGGIAPAARNLLSGSTAPAGLLLAGVGAGVVISGVGATGNLVQGNSIGTDKSGTASLANALDGVVLMDSASNNTVGGVDPGMGNAIAFNGRTGVAVVPKFDPTTIPFPTEGNRVLSNSIFNNGQLGIDLAINSFSGVLFGVTPNDLGDPDGPHPLSPGANRQQNFPEITGATLGAGLSIEYAVPSLEPHSAYPLRVEFFLADADPANPEGKTFLGFDDTYDEPGPKTFTIPFPQVFFLPGDRIVATATDDDGNTSEFSAALLIERPAVPSVTLEVSGSPMEETGGTATVTARLSAVSPADVTVFLKLSGTASETLDYRVHHSVLNPFIFIPAGELSGTFPLFALPDTQFEGIETIVVDIDRVTNATESETQQKTALIADDDPLSINILSPVVREGAPGEITSYPFTFTLSQAVDVPVTVDFRTVAITADASDFTAASGTVTFAPNQVSATVTVLLRGDALVEPDETFLVELSGPTLNGVAVGSNTIAVPAALTGLIVNDDSQIIISALSFSEREGAAGELTPFRFTVSLSHAVGVPVTVDYRTLDEAADGSDFTAASGTVTFEPNQTSAEVTVFVRGDAAFEAHETFRLALSHPTLDSADVDTATILVSSTQGRILNDDLPNVTLAIVDATQSPLVQRSYIRFLELEFGNEAGLSQLIAEGLLSPQRLRLALERGDIGISVNLKDKVTQSGSKLVFDFGEAGIGGNRNSNLGDGNYAISLDLDGSGGFETTRTFHRLFGDANGDGFLNNLDVDAIVAAIAAKNRAFDVNGDGYIDARDELLVRRAARR